MSKSCTDCRHYEYDWDTDSDGYFLGDWAACRARNGVSNLKNFPFRRTECETFQEKSI